MSEAARISEEEHTLDADQRHSDVEEDAAILSDSSDPNDKAAFNDSIETVYVERNNITTWNKLPCTNHLSQSLLKKRTSRDRAFVTLNDMKSQMSCPLFERSSTIECCKRSSLVPISRSSINIAYVPATKT